MATSAKARKAPVKGQQEFLVGGQEFSMPADRNSPCRRTAVLQIGGQQFSKSAARGQLHLVLLGTGLELAGATTGCLSGDVLGHSCPPASPGSLSTRR